MYAQHRFLIATGSDCMDFHTDGVSSRTDKGFHKTLSVDRFYVHVRPRDATVTMTTCEGDGISRSADQMAQAYRLKSGQRNQSLSISSQCRQRYSSYLDLARPPLSQD